MRRSTASVLAGLALATIVAACAEVPSGPSPAMTGFTGQGGLVTAGECTTIGELDALARAVFRTGSPNVSSVLGKLRTLDQDVQRGRLTSAIARAHDIVDYTLKHYHAGNLPGTETELTAFVNSVYCYAGIDIDIDEPSNSHLILPSDQQQVVYSIDSKAAILFLANPVSEPTLIEFAQLEEQYPPGGGPLDTKLDQYPGFLTITKTSETNAPLLRPATVGICASGVIPQDVRDRLRLGHGKTSGFEIAAPADAEFLDCENLIEDVPSIGALGRLANLLMPKPLHARRQTVRRGGGVGGTVTEFSPFAPVDPQLRSGGGVGGTVTEFTRTPVSNLFSNLIVPVESCPAITGTAGHPVSASCRPFIRITTRLGTSLGAVPVTWTTTAGNGLVAAESSSECGAYASTILTATDLFGRSSICWKLGNPGSNQVRATPAPGGDAPVGVMFEPAFLTFDATATHPYLGQPTTITLIEGESQEGIAGQVAPVAPKVLVTDPYGTPVAGVTVHWDVLQGGGSVSAATSVTDAAGTARVFWTLGLGANELKAYINQAVFAYTYVAATGLAP